MVDIIRRYKNDYRQRIFVWVAWASILYLVSLPSNGDSEMRLMRRDDVRQLISNDQRAVDVLNSVQVGLDAFREAWNVAAPFHDQFMVVAVKQNPNGDLVPVGVYVTSIDADKIAGRVVPNSLPFSISNEAVIVEWDQVIDWRYREFGLLKGGRLYTELFGRLGKKESKRLADELPFGLEAHPAISAISRFFHQPDESSLQGAKAAVGDGSFPVYVKAIDGHTIAEGERVQRVDLTLEELNYVYGTTDTIRLLAKSGYLGKTGGGYTPLIFCSFTGNCKTADALIEAGVDVNEIDAESGMTALHAAVSSDCSELVKMLLQKGANPNSQSYDNRTPLFFALCPDVIDLLVRYRADVNALDSQGLTALDKFVQDGSEQLAKAIVKHGGMLSGRQIIVEASAPSTYRIDYGSVLPVRTLIRIR